MYGCMFGMRTHVFQQFLQTRLDNTMTRAHARNIKNRVFKFFYGLCNKDKGRSVTTQPFISRVGIQFMF